MEQVGINNIQEVQYKPQAAVTEPSFQGKKPEMKEDGDKKLLGALAGLGTIALGGVLVYNGIKKGKRVGIKDLEKAGIGFEKGKMMKNAQGLITDLKGNVIKDKTIKARLGKASMTIKDGKIVETITQGKKGQVVKKFTYDGNGKISKLVKDGKEITYTYNDKGKISSIIKDGKKTEFITDANGKIQKKITEIKADVPMPEAPKTEASKVQNATGKAQTILEKHEAERARLVEQQRQLNKKMENIQTELKTAHEEKKGELKQTLGELSSEWYKLDENIAQKDKLIERCKRYITKKS